MLLGLVAATTVAFANVDVTAGKLMAPYLAFTAFANALNWSVWNENPEVGCEDRICFSPPLSLCFSQCV